MKYILALSLLLFPAVAPATVTTPGSFKLYEDGSFVHYDNGVQVGTGCLPFAICND